MAQGNQSNLAGSTIDEIYHNLLSIGNVFTMYAEDMDFNTINRMHTALIRIFGGIYPMDEILRDVSLRVH